MNRARVVCIRRLFSGASRYHCSAFGRGFVWGPPEVAQLLIDLEDGSRLPPEKGAAAERFYLGVINVGKVSGGSHLLIDGQQRLAVITMLLAFARDRTPDTRERQRLDTMIHHQRFGAAPQARVQLLEDDQRWFESRILTRNATLRLPSDAPPGGPSRMLACARFLSRAFATYAPADLRRLTDFIAHNAAMVMSQAQEHSMFSRVYQTPSRQAPNLHGEVDLDRARRPAA